MLDPRENNQLFDDIRLTSENVKRLEALYKNYPSNNDEEDTQESQNESQKPLSLFLRALSKKYSSSSKTKEISKYLKAPLVPAQCEEKSTDILEWWKVNKIEYPVLSRMASDFLSMQPTCVPVERTFSIAGLTVSKLRSRLNDETVKKLLCLKSWLDEGRITYQKK